MGFIAKKLREEMTEAEKLIWYHLKAKNFFGLKFRRQEPIGEYIVDFVCYSRKLIIEIDGGQHARETKIDDTKRDKWLKSQGFIVLRFWNNDVFRNLEGVFEGIRKYL